MWTKQQLWQTLLAISGLVLLVLTISIVNKFGFSFLPISIALAILGFFINRLVNKTLNASREQAEHAIRHSNELLHYITEQDRISKILKASEEQFRNAFDHASIGMALVSPKGKFLKVNHSLTQMLGYSSLELLTINSKNLLLAEDSNSFNNCLSRLLDKTAQTCQLEIRVSSNKNSNLWLMWSASLVEEAADNSSHFIFQFQDITDRKRAEERLVHDAVHDALTDLPNRVLFLDRLDVAFKRAKRNFNNQFAVLYLDFDRFKLVNDSFGHLIGDKLLIEISKRLKKILRASDTVARLGGDEFTMLVEEIASLDEAIPIVERIREEMAKPFNLDGQVIYTTVSIGIASWSRKYERSEFILRDSDTALYQAKSNGGNRYELFNDEMHARALNSLQIETDLRQAVERNEFRVVYQPIIELESKKLSGFEALIRWQHPTRGLVMPLEFIPIAEETGLIVSIGEWVLHESCRQMVEWQKNSQTYKNLSVSVNVSSKQFLKSELISVVSNTLKTTGLSSDCLKLEITESAMVDNIEQVVKVMEELKKLGVKLSIDDFGTGYSSLSNLHRLPLSSLKIDRSFVNQMQMNAESDEIVKTIVSLAQSLNLEIVAEGIETIDQLSQLNKLSCQLGQGYYFAKPLEVAAVEALFGSLGDTCLPAATFDSINIAA
jgi:diguanylate cyclase (GGDEF)-like protein/PAS domain S-box-containing protein